MAQTRSMTLLTAVIAVVAVTFLSGHVAPSVDDNNRYVKVTPMAAGARLAYTVFFGEVPGAAERRLLDTNRDGRIDPAEAKAFGDKLAAEIAANLDVDAGGQATRVRWTIVDVGLGNDAVAAGAFSVDMIAYVCAPGTGTHRVHLRDSFRIPRPGETEVKVDDSPGVTVTRASIGAADDPRHDYRFVGAGGPLTDDGLTVEWTATSQAPLLPPGTCAAPSAHHRGGRGWLLPVIAVAIAAGATGLVLFRRRARAS
jgi:hypothetical protein